MTTRWPQERLLFYRHVPKAKKATAPESAPAPTTAPESTRVSVGIWDMNTSAGSLPKLLEVVEDKQSYFSFFNVVAPFQTGLTLPGPQVAAEWAARTGDRMPKESAAENVSAIRLFHAAEPVLKQLQIDWLVVVVASMISDARTRKDALYNLFSTTKGKTVLVSTYDLRRYAAEGGRPFEVALLGCAVSGLVSAMVPEVQYQDKSTGSIFDRCMIRRDIVKCIEDPHIDPENRARIPEKILKPTEQILDVLKTYSGSATPTQMKRQLRAIDTLKKRAPPGMGKGTSRALTASNSSTQKFAFSSALKALQDTLKTRDAGAKAKLRTRSGSTKGPSRRK
jgi:hypothetical protein